MNPPTNILSSSTKVVNTMARSHHSVLYSPETEHKGAVHSQYCTPCDPSTTLPTWKGNAPDKAEVQTQPNSHEKAGEKGKSESAREQNERFGFHK